MNDIRIAMVVFSHYPSDVRVRRAVEALTEAGSTVEVIALRRDGEPRQERVNGGNVYRINIKQKRGSRLRYFWEYGYFVVFAFAKLAFFHLIRDYNVVHVHNLPDFLVFSALFPKLTGAKVILDIHDLMPEFYMRKFGIPESHKVINGLKYLEKLSIKFADHVITASPFFRERLIKRSSTSNKCTTIMNLPDRKYFNSAVETKRHDNNKFRIIYPGTLGEIHGVDIVIKAIELIVKQTDIPIQFHIYGAGAEQERIKLIKLIRELGLKDFVYFHPKVPAEKLAGIYKSMDVGVVPKRNGIFAQDAMSTKLFEFAAVGLPTVVSRTKSDSLYFDDSMVMFFEPENANELSDCIIKLYRNPHLRKSFSQRSRLLDHKINWENEKRRLITVYGRMVSF